MTHEDTLSSSSIASSDRETESVPVFINPFSRSQQNGREAGDRSLASPSDLPDYSSNTNVDSLEPVWSILPLYHMYTSTVSESVLRHPNDDSYTKPPMYNTSHENNVERRRPSSRLEHFENFLRQDNQSQYSEVESEPRNLIASDDNSQDWQNTILGNIHKLDNLSNTKNEFANAIKFSVHFTEMVGEPGVKQKELDILNYEYKQGDIINGYILIENTSGKPIPFDAFYVVFEGTFTVGSVITGDDPTKDKEITYKKNFLEMFDLHASWHHGFINRIPTDDPDTIIDPIDNTHLPFGDNSRHIRHDYVHKRFFTFKIPEKLLDSSCSHSLSRHSELPSTLGLTKAEKQFNLKNPKLSRKVRDFSFINSNISYSVSARFIGRASMYGEKTKPSGITSRIVDAGGDEFLVLKDTRQNLRIVQESLRYNHEERVEKTKQETILYNNLKSRLDEHIEIAESILKESTKSNLDDIYTNFPPVETRERANTINPLMSSLPSSMSGIRRNSTNSTVGVGSISRISTNNEIPIKSNVDELAKIRQLYKPNNKEKGSESSNTPNGNDTYKVFFPWQKRTLSLTSKFQGAIVVSTPKKPYSILYIRPVTFRQPNSSTPDNTWNLELPFDFEYIQLQMDNLDKKIQLPEIKKIGVEFICMTIKSDHGPIPVEINNDMLFKDTTQFDKPSRLVFEYNTDYLESNVVGQIREKFVKIHVLASKLGPEGFRMDSQLVEDVKVLCNLETKNNTMTVGGVKIKMTDSKDKVIALNKASELSKVSWSLKGGAPTTTYIKKFSLQIDLSTSKLKIPDKQVGKSFDNFCLVPNFQMCQMARFYYIRVSITLLKNEVILVNIPIEVVK